jgi:bifunctional pyridoxal-dependent enzyme with beta-cystathionase and maltose regulon repressor activities
MNDGTTFGVRDRSGANDGGSGDAYQCCFRLNLGCPRAQLLDALDRIAKTIKA